ncbi:MAG: glutamyl-tRNA reductase [Bacteroidota bacterium]|nr:glutamyl-tRNA reductase [Bacteroidota bacterium]MDP4236836.1 glutamyl-tRNA reductase [Bacteroidota bacterium]
MPSKLIAIGLSHHRVPVELREQVTFSPSEIRSVLGRLKEAISDEALLVSTCNRTELYVRPSHDELSADYLIDFLLEAKELPGDVRIMLKQEFSRLSYCDAILHMFEVVAGIDSQILGDQQIFSQIKEAFRIAEEIGSAGTFMTKFAHSAFHVAKRVRSETELTVGAGTISYAAVEFARKVFDDFLNRTALVIGAGETAELSAGYLVEKNIGTLIVANRTRSNAEKLLKNIYPEGVPHKSKVIGLDGIQDILPSVDIVISATGSPDLVLDKDQVEQALELRKYSVPLVLIDIAVPRDIDPAIASLPNVFLKDIDDLSAIVDQNLQKRKSEIPRIKAIINDEFENFLELFTKLEVGPTIAELRKRFEEIRQEELDRHRKQLPPEQFSKLDDMTRKMMNRLLHTPTIMLKEPRTTKDDLQARIETVRMLFALDEKKDKKEN